MKTLTEPKRRGAWWRRRVTRGERHRRRRASTTVFVAAAIPTLLVVGGLTIDQSYEYYRYQLLKRTAQAAALAAETNLSSYFTAGGTYSASSMSTINSAVNTIVADTMPSTQYGAVVTTTTSNTTSGVQIGTWNNTTKTFTATTTNPNAVQVTAVNTAANGNAVPTFMSGIVGKSSVDMTTTAVASYGNGLSGAGGFNTIILNDLSMSFSSEIPDQRAADVAILNCVSAGTNGNGNVGLTAFVGHAQTLYALAPSTAANISAMTTYIDGTLNYCGKTGMPACSGSNVAAGLYSAITQLQTAGLANKSSNIILITDGVPNADSITYAKADGTYPTPTSSSPVCSTKCTDANLWTMAQDQAAYAKSLGINISTVYYSGDTTGSSTIATYSADLASLVTGTGIALVAPSTATIDTSFAKFCSSMGSAVKLVQ